MNYMKDNLGVVLAIALPLALILGIFLTTYIPSQLVTTEYNFVYATCDDNQYRYQCDRYLQERYGIVGGTINQNEVDLEMFDDKFPEENSSYTARLFVHDTVVNESREVTIEEAKSYSLNTLLTSPDGVAVENINERGGDFFLIYDGGSSRGYYLTKGSGKKKLNLIGNDGRYYYGENFRFIGWIE